MAFGNAMAHGQPRGGGGGIQPPTPLPILHHGSGNTGPGAAPGGGPGLPTHPLQPTNYGPGAAPGGGPGLPTHPLQPTGYGPGAAPGGGPTGGQGTPLAPGNRMMYPGGGPGGPPMQPVGPYYGPGAAPGGGSGVPMQPIATQSSNPLPEHNPFPNVAPPGTGTGANGEPVQNLPPGTSTQPGNVASTAPLPYQQFGGIAQVNPSYVDPANAQGYYGQYTQLLGQSMQPYFQQQNQQLNSDLRARGIQNSGAAAQLEGNLLGQQGATLAGNSAPLLQQAFGYNQEADLANAQYANAASLYNANQYGNAVNQNYQSYNNYLNELLGLGASNYGALQGAYLNSFGPNTGVQSGYNNALAGMQNIYGDVYGGALNQQAQQMNALGSYMAMSGG